MHQMNACIGLKPGKTFDHGESLKTLTVMNRIAPILETYSLHQFIEMNDSDIYNSEKTGLFLKGCAHTRL